MEDREFSVNLLNQTIYHEKEFERDIAEKIKNWELERLALIDIILLKMAMAEILFFPEIPVKVSMNEYIDIAKYYSTPKSSVFINGIIDRLVAEKRKEGKINKAGRGLIE
jgi:N utilization substance protein B